MIRNMKRDFTRRVFVAWRGPPMSAARAASLEKIRRNVGVETVIVTENSLDRWVAADAPLHPAFGRLSAVHQADYLRCYLMHHHGGGYVDLKPLTASWAADFERLETTPGALAVGYREPGPQGVASFGLELVRGPRILRAAWWRRRWLQLNYRSLIGTCGFVFRPRTELTAEWFGEMTRRLDGFAARLAEHPARHPRDHAGFVIDGRPSEYPVPWMALLGDVFHPLVWRYRRRLLKTLPPPGFEGYL
jgi:hypothetical protein